MIKYMSTLRRFLPVLLLGLVFLGGCTALKTAQTAADSTVPGLGTALATVGQWLLALIDALFSGALTKYVLPFFAGL